MTLMKILCKGEILTLRIFPAVCMHMNSLLYFWNMQPDVGCLVQPKHVAFWITIINVYGQPVLLLYVRWKVCVTKDCFPMVQWMNKKAN